MNILDVILGRKEKTGEKEWDAIEKSLINAESIEKSRKGKRRANHKYIRVFTKADGKDEYLYKKDMLSPFKSLLRFFGIGEEKIAKTYEKENIERSYGVDKKTYGMHVLEYLTNRKKWDGLFSKKDERKKHKKPVAQEVIEKRAAERKAKLNGTTEAPAEQADKKEDNKDKIPTINRSLMRKVYSLYNPIPEDKTEPEIKADVKPASEKVKEYIGRKMTKKPDGTTVMTWEDGRIIHTDRKGNVIYDNAETSQPKAEKDLSPAENATVAPTESAVENTSNTGARLVNVPVQIKERKVYIRGRMSKVTGYTELYINGNKVSFFKDYESGWNDMSEDDRNIINSLPNVSGMNFKETETVYKDLKGTKEEIIKQIENIGYDNSKLEKDFINCINNIEDEKEPEGANAEQKVKYAKLTKDGASLSIYKDGRIFLNNFMTAGGNMIWIQKDPHYKPEYGKYTDDWDLKTYGIIPFSSKNMFEELEKLIPDIQRMTYDEIVAYIRNDTKSLSEAMKGNQNARKPFTVDDFTVDTKNLIAETKANDDYINRMLSLQNSYKGYTDQMLANEIKLKSIGSTLTDKERRLGAKMALEMLIAEMRARNAEKKEQSPVEDNPIIESKTERGEIASRTEGTPEPEKTPTEQSPTEIENISVIPKNKELADTGVRFSKEYIASNGNKFRIGRPTEKFWDLYKMKKQELKDEGYSVYKLDGEFLVYDWTNKTKATEEEKKKEEEEKRRFEKTLEKELIKEFELYALDQDAKINKIDNMDDLKYEVENSTSNPESVWEMLYANVSQKNFYTPAESEKTIPTEQSPVETTEIAAEEHQDRSEAMMGNDNAKKYGLPDGEYAYLVKLVWDNLKAGSPKSVNEILNGTEEFNKLSDEQKKQFSKDVLYVKVTDDITAANDRYLQKKALERQKYFDTLPEKNVSNVTFNSKNDVNDFIRNNIAEDIDLSNVKESDVKAIEPIINQIADRLKRLGLPKFNGIKFSARNKDVVMAVDGTTGELSINLNRVKNPKKLWEAEQKYKEKHLAEMQRFHPKENYTLENVTRWSAFADENDVIRSTVDHEIGHYLLNSKSGSFSDVIRKLNDTRNGYDNFGNATIGMYHTASLDSLETIAELFAMYMGKERKLLPKEIIDTVESITGVQPMFEESDFAPVESSQEEHENRSKAMLGNDNAKKDGITEEPVSNATAETTVVEPQTEKEMKEEQKKTEKAREKAGLKKPGKNYGERVSAMEDAYFSYNPDAENYAYKDTGYIAGSQKEKIAQFWADVQERGGGVKIEDIDWEALEENLRYAESKIIKANILKKPDFEALRENGMTGGAAYFYNRLIDCIPTKPATNTPEMHKQYVLAINTFQERMEKCKTVDEMTKEMSEIGDEMVGNYVGADKLPEAIALQRQIDEATEKSRAEDEELSNAENKLWEIPEIKQWVKDNNSEIKRYYGKPYPFGFTDRRFETEDNKLMENFLSYWQKNSKYYDFIKENEEKLSKYESFKEYKKLLDEYEINSNKKYTRDVRLISPSCKKAIELKKQKKDFIQKKNDEYKNSAEYKMWAAFGPQASGTKIKNRFYEYMESADGFNSFIYYGNKTILNHYRNAKRGKFDDWEWLPKKEENSVSGEKKERKESFQLLVATEHERKGGKDVSVKTTQELKDMFKLRDIQSGEWVLSDPRSAKWHVDRCCEGFSDLCDVTGIPENLISLNGRLALAIGARGSGGALAHYEPVERVINITKMHGGGSLAHEWFHAFDNMLSEAMLGGDINAWLTKPGLKNLMDAPNNVIPEIKQAFANLVDAMKKGDNPVMKSVQVTDTDKKNPDKVLRSVLYFRNYSASAMDVFSSVKKAETYEEANRILMDNFKALTSYNGRFNSTKVRDFQKAQRALAAKFGKTDVFVFTGETASQFFIESYRLDRYGKKSYWSTTHEMAARAFSGFIGDNLRNAGRLNTYLTSHDTNDSYVLYGVKPNPEGEERERINKAFKELFDAVKSTGAIRKAIDWLDVESVAKSTARLPKIAIKLGKDGNPVFLFRKSAWTE